MKNSIVSFTVFVITIVATADSFSQKFSRLDVSPLDASYYPNSWKNSDKLVKVIYSRPQLKGRSLSSLAVADSSRGVWRTGANEASEVTFFKDVLFAGEKVKAGTYTLFTVPAEKEWTLILSSVRNVWGHYSYDKSNDIIRVLAKVSKSDKTIEVFSIAFHKNKEECVTMHMGWENTIVSVSVQEIIN